MAFIARLVLITALASSSAYVVAEESAGDIAAGKARAVMCSACHGASGISVADTYPNLAGQKRAYITNQLENFKNGSRKNPIMSGMAAGLSEQDILNVAAYFSSLTP